MSNSVAAIVVTHNRKELLEKCIRAILGQTETCDLVIVDNASTDGTSDWLAQRGILSSDRIYYLRLDKNTGASGGFHSGIEYCLSRGWEWFWIMDDDAFPENDALRHLVRAAVNRLNVYASVAVGLDTINRQLCFPARVLGRKKSETIEYYDSLRDVEKVEWVPFLGFCIHRDLVDNIGLPDKDFFILDDDVEYSTRARAHGSEVFLVKKSIINHPFQPTTPFRFFNSTVYLRQLPAWKIYYDSRNKIAISKRYSPLSLWTRTLPGIILRALLSAIQERQRTLLSAYAQGIKDGIMNRMGVRYLPPLGRADDQSFE